MTGYKSREDTYKATTSTNDCMIFSYTWRLPESRTTGDTQVRFCLQQLIEATTFSLHTTSDGLTQFYV